MSILASLICRMRRPKSAQLTEGYRAPADPDPVAELGIYMRGLVTRVRVLERQLAEQGQVPASTPTGRQIIAAAELVESLARGEGVPSQWNTLELRELAGLLRGLGDWV
jgi:hypothetical protein